MKKEEKSLPIEVASMDLSNEQKKYVALGVKPFSSDTQPASDQQNTCWKSYKKCESNNQNMESESENQNKKSESNNHNMESESSKWNMESESSNQNMEREGSNQNKEDTREQKQVKMAEPKPKVKFTIKKPKVNTKKLAKKAKKAVKKENSTA